MVDVSVKDIEYILHRQRSICNDKLSIFPP
jgi:hypothetical protein